MVISQALKASFTPFAHVSKGTKRNIAIGYIVSVILLWSYVKMPFIPMLGETLGNFGTLYVEQGLIQNLWISFKLFVHALVLSVLFSAIVAYLSSLPIFRPGATVYSTFRFVGMTGLLFIFMIYFGAGHKLKVAMEFFAISTFLTTSMVAIIQKIPQEKLDHAYTLRMGAWRALFEIGVLGTAADFYEAVRQNAAIGWMMLTSIEALSRSEGGIGVMLMNQDKHLILGAIFAIQLTFYVLGLIQDFGMGWFKPKLFRWSTFATAGR
jgi:NitT/TauT family transport system permease protein